jgi:hypothetical protein
MATRRDRANAQLASQLLFALTTAPCVAILAALLVGCGPPPDSDAPAGTTVTQDGVAYSVQFSRELNLESPDDRVFLGGPARKKGFDRPGTTLLGVFVQARDDASAPRHAVAAPRLVTAFGGTFAPLQLPKTDPFAYRPRRLGPGRAIPDPQTVAAESPEDGLVLVYRVPTGVFLTDRPFTLRFGSDDRAASVQLDI